MPLLTENRAHLNCIVVTSEAGSPGFAPRLLSRRAGQTPWTSDHWAPELEIKGSPGGNSVSWLGIETPGGPLKQPPASAYALIESLWRVEFNCGNPGDGRCRGWRN